MAMEQEAANETPALEANLPIMKTIVNIAPLLGLSWHHRRHDRLVSGGGALRAFQPHAGSRRHLRGAHLHGDRHHAGDRRLHLLQLLRQPESRRSMEDMEYYGAELVNYMTGRLE